MRAFTRALACCSRCRRLTRVHEEEMKVPVRAPSMSKARELYSGRLATWLLG